MSGTETTAPMETTPPVEDDGLCGSAGAIVDTVCAHFQQLESSSQTAPANKIEVDEKLYSRQLYVMGHEAQRRMMKSSALVLGVSGLGAEIAKNVILAGISSITLLDPHPCNSFDLGGNFYLSESDIGATASRADICRPKLADLNPYVTVSVKECGIAESDMVAAVLSLIPTLSCIVVTAPLLSHASLVRINAFCRQHNVCFIYTLSMGLFGQVFCDFGSSFVVADKDAEQPISTQVESILCSNPAVVKVLEDLGRHNLESGDVVQLNRVKGMPHLNDTSYKVRSTGPFTFELLECDTSSCSENASQGYVTQLKQPVTISHKSYEEKCEDPGEILMSDFAKFTRPATLHLAFKALQKYRDGHAGELPSPGDTAATLELLSLSKSLDSSENSVITSSADERLILHLASGSRSVVSPMCAALGGIVGQEILKACSGKFMPIDGFFYLDADECLPENIISPAETTGKSRYDSQIALFGAKMQQQLLDQSYFLVGAGAIGCEMLKNWALMGIGCGTSGKIHITDMDTIEKSNLSRQFLFRNNDIGKFKSACAAEASQAMNPNMNITAYQEKVAQSSENVFGDSFFSNLTGVCTALDNVDARLYVDSRCVFYRLPMLESGTLGTKGNTQVVIPHLTENYGATRDPPEKSIPVCTLKNFPHQIEHTLQWARDYFEGAFKQSCEDVNGYLGTSGGKSEYLEKLASMGGHASTNKVDTLLSIRKTLVVERPRGFDDCVTWARLMFEDLFSSQIRQLLFNFPEDQLTSTGTKFWSGSKRCPIPLSFDMASMCDDAEMKNHYDFIVAASNLRAQMFGIKGHTDEAYFCEKLSNIIVPDFTPKDGVKIAANEAEAKQESNNSNSMMSDPEEECEKLMTELPTPSSLAGFRLTPIDFDKDIDDHMLFVTACSNLRALNYGIPTEDTHRSRAIAGKIIPAIATTTALVTGLVCLELYKVVGTPAKTLTIDAYKSGFVNLSVPFMTLSEPSLPAKTACVVKGKEWKWTAWDSIDLDRGDITLRQFMSYFETEYQLDISMLSYGVSILYSFFSNKKALEKRMDMPMSEVAATVSKKELPANQLFLIFEIIANDLETDDEVELPYIKFKFR